VKKSINKGLFNEEIDRVYMRKGIHPEAYREIVFLDVGTGTKWISKSTVKTEKTIKYDDGKEYPLFELPISSYSHPFFTGQQRLVDTEGRVDKFNKKFSNKYAKKDMPTTPSA
jgi:large subunit ribosomal protein L31